MKLLLDTNVILRWAAQLPIASEASALIADPANRCWVSACALQEIAIKVRAGKLRVDADLPSLITLNGFEILSVTAAHAWAVRDLPLIHRDPFDHLVIAQARIEQMALVTSDRIIERYDVAVIRA